MSSDISHRITLTGEGRSLGSKISGGRGRPPANILIPLERQLNALQALLNFFFCLLRLRRYKAKRVKTRSLQEWVGHFEPKFQGEGVVPAEYILVSTILDTLCYPILQTAPCYVPPF